jgi:CheY-like chemotaxis protein
VNQRLAVRLLEKQGHRVVVANNGREALAILDQEPFDLALMDVQMPEISGFEATATIREQERASGAHLPIIAMTAYAMKGDRERCLEAGMDGYVSKPIQAAELFKAIAELVPVAAVEERTEPAREESVEVFNQALALEQVGGDAELLVELIGLFSEDSERLLTEVRRAVACCESKGIERAAHTLKGTASNFGAHLVVATAQRLEQMGRTSDLASADAVCADLEAALERLNVALETFVARHRDDRPESDKDADALSAADKMEMTNAI